MMIFYKKCAGCGRKLSASQIEVNGLNEVMCEDCLNGQIPGVRQ